MSGLLRRIRRPGAAEETRTEATALPEPAHGSAPETAPVRADGSPLPAGVGPEDLELRSGAGRRGKVRRRARFLRRARELALRDLGGLVYEANRRDQDGGKLVKEKVQHLGVIDAELRVLEVELGTPRGETVLREPGVGGTCPRCGELHASDAHYCSRCGLDLTAVPVEQQAAVATSVEPVANEPAAEAAPSETTSAQTEAGEPTPAEQPRRASKRWWQRRSAVASETTAADTATSEATAAEPATSEAAAATPSEPAASEAAAADPAASETTSAEPATSEAPAAEPATSKAPAAEPATSEATAAEPATSEATAAEPAASETTAAEPPTTEASAAEQPTTDLAAAPDSSQAGNGRAATKNEAPDPDRAA